MKINSPDRAKTFLLGCSFLGGLYCLLNAAGAELFCATQGCEIYAGYGLFGLSFYIYGFTGFLGIFLLVLWCPRRPARLLLAIAVGLALVFDTLFLIYQSLLWPCSSCHVFALLIGLTAFFAVTELKVPGRKLLIGIGLFWLVFFIFVGLSVVKEVAFPPWPIYGSAEASVKVYFSPTCPACEEAVRKNLNNPKTANETAFYPVTKNDEDEARLASLIRQSGKTVEADGVLGLFKKEVGLPATLGVRDKLRFFCNKMALAKANVTTVPMIVSPYIIETGWQKDDFFSSIDTFFGTKQEQGQESGCSTVTTKEDCGE